LKDQSHPKKNLICGPRITLDGEDQSNNQIGQRIFWQGLAEHLYTIFEKSGFFTLVYWCLRSCTGCGASELLTITGNEAGVTCFKELSQHLCGRTNILNFEETLMVVVAMMMMMMTTTIWRQRWLCMHGPVLFLILNICASSSLIHSPLQLALLQSLFSTQ
jgi:hypothetical protein